MGKVLVLQNASHFELGSFEEELNRKQIPFEYHRVYEGSPLPSADQIKNYAGFIVLGGPLSLRVDQPEKTPWLAQELFFLRSCLDQHYPIFAVGQGANLLAKAQGAWVERSPQLKEIGWVTAEVYPDYSRNSVIYSQVEEKKFPVFGWYDTINGFPPQGYWYLTTTNCRYLSFGVHGNCYGFNFHPEITENLLNEWLKAYPRDLPNKDAAEQIKAQAAAGLEYNRKLARKIIHALESFLK